MNPVGAVIIILGILVLTMGVKGTQVNVKAALTGATPTKLAPSTASSPGPRAYAGQPPGRVSA